MIDGWGFQAGNAPPSPLLEQKQRRGSEDIQCQLSASEGKGMLQSRIDRLALQRENAEDTLVYAAQRLVPHETLQPLHAQRELTQRQ